MIDPRWFVLALGIVVGYAMGWVTPRLFDRAQAVLDHEPGNTAPMD